MKRKTLSLLLAIICLLLAACSVGGEKESEVPSVPPSTSAPSEESTAPSIATEPSSAPTEPTLPSESTNEEEELLTALQKLFNTQNLILNEEDWYAQCLTSEFSAPEKVNLEMVFYSGIRGKQDELNQLSEEERTYLASVWDEYRMHFDINRLPVEEMNRVLQKYFGLTLDETEKVGLEAMTYWGKTDCYYNAHSDSVFFRPQVLEAVEQEDGTIAMYYTDDADGKEATAVAMLKPVEDGYQILSNEYFD